ncbi:hypothetical protein [Methylotuvimicrobium sp. KM2]|uniref:hypothetical protein n=1 Tax=Methylotuvimicrobium sp. KM2 TaxID=3133976 RepID=UPI003101A270
MHIPNQAVWSYDAFPPYETLYEVPSTDLLTAQIGAWAWISGDEQPDFIKVRNDRPESGGSNVDEILFEIRRGLSFPYEDSKAYHWLSIKDGSEPLDFLSNTLLPAFFDISQITLMTGRIETGDYTSGPNYLLDRIFGGSSIIAGNLYRRA